MKKFIFLLGLLISTPVFANTITLSTISSDSIAGTFNSNFTTISNVINGTIEGSTDSGATVSNVKADSLFEINMADNANPRIFANETLQIGTDTLSGTTLDQDSFVYSGCVPADDTDLTSDISACVAYINGYRQSKTATSTTYTASRDCYVDISQNAVYTVSCVTNGAAAPAVTANSGRVSKVVTDGTEITTITDLANRRTPGLVIPANYRDGLTLSRDSTTVVIVSPGVAEINNTMVSKTTATTLTISTAGDWAGGTSLRATSAYGYVGMDASGNLKMHTTAPTHFNYAVSNTAGKKRYVTWSSTVYRVLGWFFMNATGSGELNQWGVSNLSDIGVPNIIELVNTTVDTVNDTAYGSDLTGTSTQFYTSGGQVVIKGVISGDNTAASAIDNIDVVISDGDDIANSVDSTSTGNAQKFSNYPSISTYYAQGTKTFSMRMKIANDSVLVPIKKVRVQEF